MHASVFQMAVVAVLALMQEQEQQQLAEGVLQQQKRIYTSNFGVI